MNFLSLFSGIGGFDLGLERAGMECVGQVEIDKKCQRVLAKHWPHVKRIGDIRDVTESDFGAVELICGGFPCQPFSTAGKRKGAKDNRFLWPEMVRIIAAYRPTWVLGENVAGIVSMALDQVHSDLESIGYQVQSFIIPACAVGAPHRRDRVWIVAHAKSGNDRGGTGEVSSKNEQQEAKRQEERVCSFGNAGETSANARLFRPQECEEQTAGTVERSKTILSDTGNQRLQGSERGGAFYEQGPPTSGPIAEFCQDVRDSTSQGFPDWCGGSVGQPFPLTEFERPSSDGKIREIERDFCGVPHGVSGRVDRLKQLGNAIVPQIAEIIGRAIMATYKQYDEKGGTI